MTNSHRKDWFPVPALGVKMDVFSFGTAGLARSEVLLSTVPNLDIVLLSDATIRPVTDPVGHFL